MFDNFLEASQILYQNKEPFAIALVVNREIPSSGKPGDKAVIQKDGKIIGWIGGGCTRGIVLKEAVDAMKDGKPRLVRIGPFDNVQSKAGVTEYKMTCLSGGSVEVYIEPVLPRPSLLIMGKSQVAMSLSAIAKAINYQVIINAGDVDPLAFPLADSILEEDLNQELIRPNTCIVVCTQGENDEKALAQALASEARYVSFIASRKKANAVFSRLRESGISFDELKRIKTPAGMDINAKLAEEIAISILAEIISFFRSEEAPAMEMPSANPDSKESNIYINPVCNIPVEKSTAKHVIVYENESYYFCCDGCKVAFEKEPARYAAIAR